MRANEFEYWLSTQIQGLADDKVGANRIGWMRKAWQACELLLTRERDEARAIIATAYREAAEHAHNMAHIMYASTKTSEGDAFDEMGNFLDALIPATAIHAEKLLVAQARQRESQKWHDKMKSHSPMCTQKEAESSWECQFLLDATAALEAIQKEKPDGK